MKAKFIVRGGLLAAAASVAVFAAAPSYADTGGGEISGSGSISPGLTTTPAAQSFSFTGSGNIATTSVHGSFTCTVNGSSTGTETVATGQGTFSGSCTGAGSVTVSNGTYLRAGGNVQISATASGAVNGSVVGHCSFVATSANPVTTFDLACGLTIH